MDQGSAVVSAKMSSIMKILFASLLLWTVLLQVSATPLHRTVKKNALDVTSAQVEKRLRTESLQRRSAVCEPVEDKTVTVTHWKTRHIGNGKQPGVTRITETSWIATTVDTSSTPTSPKETTKGPKPADSFPPVTKSLEHAHDTKEPYTSVTAVSVRETQSRSSQTVQHDTKQQSSSSVSRMSTKSSTIVTTSHLASKDASPTESTPAHSHRLSTGPRPACSAEYHDEPKEHTTKTGSSQTTKHSRTKNAGPSPTTVIKTQVSGTDLTITATSLAGGKFDCGKYNIFGIEVCINGSGNGNQIKF